MIKIPVYKIEVNHYSRVYRSGQWIDGKYMRQLENKLKEYLEVDYVILTNSGSSALLAAYWALSDYLSQKELLVDPYTFPATYRTAESIGYRLRFKRLLENFQPELKSPKILKAITHLYGQPQMEILETVSPAVEDACQSFGATIQINGQIHKVGTITDAGCFSFYPTKTLHTCGHGGAVVTNNKSFYRKMKIFVESGRWQGKMTAFPAMNLRMDEIKAEFILKKLRNYDKHTQIRREIAEEYCSVIPSSTQKFLVGKGHIYSIFNLLVSGRDNFRKFLEKKGIETLVYYSEEILPREQRKNYRDITRRIVALPCRHNLKIREVRCIKECLRQWFSENYKA